jgi:hypothetical protein
MNTLTYRPNPARETVPLSNNVKISYGKKGNCSIHSFTCTNKCILHKCMLYVYVQKILICPFVAFIMNAHTPIQKST